MSSLLIRNGTIVTATDHYRGDVLIRNEKVAAIGDSLDETADLIKMYGSPRNNSKQLQRFIVRISEKRTDPSVWPARAELSGLPLLGRGEAHGVSC